MVLFCWSSLEKEISWNSPKLKNSEGSPIKLGKSKVASSHGKGLSTKAGKISNDWASETK